MKFKIAAPYFFLIFYVPIFFINNIWDGSIISYGFSVSDISGIKNWYFESSSNFQFYVIKLLYLIKEISSLPNEIIFDTFTLIIFLLFCVEVKKYFQKIFRLNDDFNNLCFVLVLTFPVWNFLTEINLGLYITCFYLAIVGYRFFSSEILLKKLIGILLIFLSFSIKSNFAFIVGLSFLEFSYNLLVNKKND